MSVTIGEILAHKYGINENDLRRVLIAYVKGEVGLEVAK